MTNLLIVESPGKIKKLKKILGSSWEVKASMGHIRQLSNDGADSLGFSIQGNRIQCKYAAKDNRSKQTISSLKSAVRVADRVFLASDPDREGETIAWHLADVLNLENPQRVVYQEITQSAVQAAIKSPRPLDWDLVAAGRCRDVLDKLVGYKGSPLVWRLNNGAKSVGRVQSATLHIVCAREREIWAFTPQDYWSVFVEYREGLKAFYNGATITPEQDDQVIDDTGLKEQTQESTKVLSQMEADRLVAVAQNSPHQVVSVEGRLTSKKPPAPFTTSTLQQVAGSRIKFSPEQTMKVAQKLYEAGLITYMRTDSVQLSSEFCQSVRQWLQVKDPDNVPEKVSTQKNNKDAQEAHEAIRPTDLSVSSAELKEKLSDDEFRLYFLIWMRSIASQCKPAKIRKTIILSQSGSVQWRAKGQVVEFKGYSAYWKDLNGDNSLPHVQQGQVLTLKNAGHEAKQTKPPSRYTEPKLVQMMEKRGIGRPSTYAPTVKTLKQRNYVALLKGKLQPTEVGMQVDEFLIEALPELLQSDFTAEMESKLDEIAHGKENWESYLSGWNSSYFQPAIDKASASLPEAKKKELELSDQSCPSCQNRLSKVLTKSKKVKLGYFLACSHGCKASDGGKSLVMFWDSSQKKWVLPGTKAEDPKKVTLTDYPCPVCKGKMEEYFYEKDGQPKSMLRCADPAKRKQKNHSKAVYFKSKGVWWSPKFGNLQ